MKDLVDNIHLGDCLDLLPHMPDKFVNLITSDLPYGNTQNNWDCIIPLDKLWEHYWRVLKPNGAVVLTASQPFTTILISSCMKYFKYTWVWDKVNKFSGHLNSKKQPLRYTEDICVFYKEQPTYNPQMIQGKPYTATSKGRKSDSYGKQTDGVTTVNTGLYYPKNIISIPGDERGTVGRIHPTQKPVALFEYLIKTYTNEGDIVLDNAIGSGTTAVAAKNLNRRFIGIEKDIKYYDFAINRIK